MSVIYKALKALQITRDGGATPGGEIRTGKQGKRISLYKTNRFLMGPVGVALLAGLGLGAGYLLLFDFEWSAFYDEGDPQFKALSTQPRPAAIPDNQRPQPPAVATDENIPPQVKQKSRSPVSGLDLPPPPPPDLQAPPRISMQNSPAHGTTPTGSSGIAFIPPAPAQLPIEGQVGAATTPMAGEDPGGQPLEPAGGIPVTPAEGIQDTQAAIQITPAIKEDPEGATMASAQDRIALQPLDEHDTETGKAGDNTGSHAAPADIRIRRQSRIAIRVKHLQTALDRGDRPRFQEELQALEQYKGSGDPYVLKMRAYWHLRNAEYAQAEALLKEVLERDGDDLDAQMNLAVLELRTDRGGEARRRLERLAEHHRQDPRLQGLMEQVFR